MKISIGSKIIDGPWGGGNLFVKNLKKYLVNKNHEVIDHLLDDDIDIILFTDPRKKRLSSSTFNDKDIAKYKNILNKNALVVQRINECDERKGTKGVNEFYIKSTKISDHIIFVSTWLQQLYLNFGLSGKNTSVILSGSDEEIFNKPTLINETKSEKIKLVTHHWSSNKFKGLEFYLILDQLLSSQEWKNKIEFTYIGNISDEFKFNNTRVLDPMEDFEIAKELKKHHVYVTGSINEPSGNHHIEAAQCGLPILYLDSGGIPEYCDGFGVKFTSTEDFEIKLKEIILNYKTLRGNMKNYNLNSTKMSAEYLHLFEKMLQDIENKDNKSNKSIFRKKSFVFSQKLKNRFNL